MTLWTAPSIRTCFKNACQGLEDSNCLTLDAARGEFVSMQILIRNDTRVGGLNPKPNDGKTLHISGARITQTEGERFDVSEVRLQAQEYLSFADGITYPDPIANHCTATVLPNTTQGIWVTFYVPYGQPRGEYQFRIDIEGDAEGELVAYVTLKVYDVEIPTPDKGEYSIEHFTHPEDQTLLDTAGYSCQAFDETWWHFMEQYAKSLRECRSNVYRINPLDLARGTGSRRIAKDKWEIDFSNFDKLMELLIQNGVAKRFALDDIMKSFHAREVFTLGYDGEITAIDVDEPEAEIWLKEYFTTLYEHICRYSNPENWIMHVQDEPQQAGPWLKVRGLVKKYMPGFICGNPTDVNVESMLGDNVDLYIPIFYQVEEDLAFYQKSAQRPDKEVWAYCSCEPCVSWYLNRVIDRPVIYPRLIGWATYSRGFKGFLHYGYSYWQKIDMFEPFGIEKYAQFKGDCMLIYPSPEDNSYRSSVRYINLRDGAQDYELLKLIEKRDREKAQELSGRVAIGYRDFNAEEKHFLDARRCLLELAEHYAV